MLVTKQPAMVPWEHGMCHQAVTLHRPVYGCQPALAAATDGIADSRGLPRQLASTCPHTSPKPFAAAIPAAGIFVSDILDAVPIDKYFELFKPSAGGEGGFIRLGLDFVRDPNELPRVRGEQHTGTVVTLCRAARGQRHWWL